MLHAFLNDRAHMIVRQIVDDLLAFTPAGHQAGLLQEPELV